MLLWLVFILTVIFLYITLIKPLKHWKNQGVPYKKPWIFVGSMGPFVFRQKSFADVVQDLYNTTNSRYIGLFSFLKPSLMLNDVELLKQLCVKDFDNFVDHRSFISEDIDPLFGKSLFSLRGQKWRHMRATLSPAFTSSKMRSMFTLISESAQQFTNHFAELIPRDAPLTLEMKDTFSRFANDVIATTAFGIKCDSLKFKDNEFYLKGKDATDFGGIRALKFFGFSVSKTLMALFRVKVVTTETASFFKNLIVNTITTREREGIIRPDMIHLLMEARKGQLKHENASSKQGDEGAGFATVEESNVGKEARHGKLDLTDDDITAQAFLFFIAGFDTISIALCHMSYELALNLDIQERLQDEIDSVYKECNGKITYEALLKMKYMDMVLTETLRKWPPAPAMDRVCTVDSYVIQPENSTEVPVFLKKNDPLWLPIYAIQRDPKYWPNPDKFDPERFSDENKGNINPLAFLPFGVGPRNCIGSRFALLEAKTVFFYLLAKFSLVVVEKTEIPLQITKKHFNLNAANGFWLGLKLRDEK